MRIEKVNDTQIRCTLTREDLEERQIKMKELTYGTDKARNLFNEMMQQANLEFGFESENIPLLIEAIPLSTESIILIISKVEYPEELDTRYSSFTAGGGYADSEEEPNNTTAEVPKLEGAEELLRMLEEKLREMDKSMGNALEDSTEEVTENEKSKSHPKKDSGKGDITKLYILNSLQDAEEVAHVLDGIYEGENELFHNHKDGKYYLFMHRSNQSAEEFNKICNLMAEYAKQLKSSNSKEAFFKEHCDSILGEHALQRLVQL